MPAIFELSGAACPSFAAQKMRKRARAAKVGRDGTVYGKRLSARSFYTHHMQRFTRAATLEHARHMIEENSALKAKAHRRGADVRQ